MTIDQRRRREAVATGAAAETVGELATHDEQPPTRFMAEWREAIRVGGLIWLAFTSLRYVIAAAAEFIGQPDHGRLQQGLLGVLKLPFTFDSGYFAEIANNGYFGARFAPEWVAFFPGYPAMMRLVSSVLSFGVSWGRLMIAGGLISAVSSLIVTLIVFRMAQVQGNSRAGVCAALLLMVWPSATFLTAAYSESFYLALATGAWWNATRGRWWVAGLLCAGASFTRINGVFLAIALVVMLLVRVARKQEPFRIRKLAATAVGASGAAAYLFYLWYMTGDPQAWQHAQFQGWGRETVWPWTSLVNTVQGFLAVPDAYQRTQWILDIGSVALCLVAAGYMAYRRYWAELTLTVISIGALASSSNYLSIVRNTLTIFPLFVIGGGILARRREWVTTLVLTLSGVWMLGTTALFTLTKWVG